MVALEHNLHPAQQATNPFEMPKKKPVLQVSGTICRFFINLLIDEFSF